MKLKFLKIRTQSQLKRNNTLRANLPYNQAQSVGVIFSVEDKGKHEEVKELIKKLEQDGKQVEVLTFLPQQKDNFDFMFDFFTEKDLSFWGQITSTTANNFTSIPFDFLFCVDVNPNPFVQNLVARSLAKCRIGKRWEKSEPYFELMIEGKNDTRSLIDSMYQYAKALK